MDSTALRPAERSDLLIYFVQRPDGGPIKIGTTIQLSVRLKQLASEHGSLRILGVMDGGRPTEQALHRRFAHLRTAGEWFEPGEDLIGFVVTEARAWNGADESVPAVVLKVTSEYQDWLMDLSKATLIPKATIVRDALAHWAENRNLPRPPRTTLRG